MRSPPPAFFVKGIGDTLNKKQIEQEIAARVPAEETPVTPTLEDKAKGVLEQLRQAQEKDRQSIQQLDAAKQEVLNRLYRIDGAIAILQDLLGGT